MRFLLLGLLATCLSAAATMDGVNLGTHISGPKVTVEELKGKVVLFEYWGVNCPPCRSSIPHLSSWQKQFDRETFVIIANHCQGGTADNTRKVWAQSGGTDAVTVIDNGELAGSNVSGIPRCFLFDHNGKLVFDGSPFQVEDALKKAVEASPGALVAGYEWKKLRKEAAMVGKRQGMAATLKAVRKHAEGADESAKVEATELLDRVTAWCTRQEQAMSAARADDPAEAFRIANATAAALKGDPAAAPFDAAVKEMKADKAVMDAVKAGDLLTKVKALADQYGLPADPEGWLARASNKGKAQEIAGGLRAVAKFTGTKAASEAAELAKTWKLGG
jgi:thiol-disulfide isomerase/thioredoxin